jgi:hypothetical protein
MGKQIWIWAAALVLGFVAVGCSETMAPATMTDAPAGSQARALWDGTPCGQPLYVPLLAGQFIDAGVVEVANDGSSLCIQITTTNNWVLTETHVAIARTLEEIPQTGSGNPKVGQFALSATHNPAVTQFDHCISLPVYGYVPGDQLVVAVHAIVQRLNENGVPVQQETAWADGLDFPGHNWATYFWYTVQSCGGNGEE